jgi:hypothetical protein
MYMLTGNAYVTGELGSVLDDFWPGASTRTLNALCTVAAR